MATQEDANGFEQIVKVSDTSILGLDALFDVKKALSTVSAKWHDIGVALRLDPNILNVIQTKNNGDPQACLSSMVTEWLKGNYDVKRFGKPTWQWLVDVVGDPAGGAHMALARDIARTHKPRDVKWNLTNADTIGTTTVCLEYGVTHPTPPSPSEMAEVQPITHPTPPSSSEMVKVQPTTHKLSKAAHFALQNREAITAKFATFQINVYHKLSTKKVNIGEFRLFVKNQFPPGDCIPPPPTTLLEIFEAITDHGLWDFFHYSPLVQIVEAFGAKDTEMKGWVQMYRKDLKSYKLATTVEEHIEADLHTANLPRAKRAKYDPRYCCRMEWKTEFIDHSLQYLAEVWKAFSDHYLVPESPPTALLDRVCKGCLSITWLVPTGLISSLIKRIKIDTEFFQRYKIQRVTVGNQCVYGEVNVESTVVESMGLIELKDYIESGKSSLKFVVSGKMGVGKSSLINGLIGKNLAKEAQSPLTVTKDIKGYKLTIEATDKSVDKTVDVVIMDCPGLGDPVNDEEADLVEIAKHCKDADLLIYCVDMRARLSIADAIGLKELTEFVGPDVWKNAMFVLTFANEAVPSSAKPRGWLETLTFGYLGSSGDSERKEKFESLLAEWEEAIPKFLRDRVKIPEQLISSVSIVPAGYRNLPPPDRTDWFSEFWFTALRKSKEEAQPAFMGIDLHRFKITPPDAMQSTPQVDNDELPINIPVGATKAMRALDTTGGGALETLIGAAVGLLGGPVGVTAGALIGAGIGVAGGGTTGAAAGLAVIISAIRKHAGKTKKVVSETLQ